MNPLLLSGWGVKVSVQDLKSRSWLTVTDGREDMKRSVTSRFKPRRLPYSSIVIDGQSGYISLRAVHWLSRNGTPVYVLDVDGSLLSSILPATSVKADLRVAQIHAADDPEKKFIVAKAIVEAKIGRSLQVLDWLSERYDIARENRVTKLEASKLRNTATVSEIRTVEGRVALRYWEAYSKVLPEHLESQGRMTLSHNTNASDPVDSALNYGYALLEGECRRAINAVGLEPSVGFLHELSSTQTRQSLTYDLMEPFRWLIDLAVLQAFESRVLGLDSFHFKFDDYRFRFNPEAKERYIELLKEHFNGGVRYRGKRLKWDTVIEQKTLELSRFLAGKISTVDFIEPSPNLDRSDNRIMRERINSLTSDEAKRLGLGKGTLHYLRRNARNERSFKLYSKTMEKLPAVT
jgi:CRISPR-associated protein Cas1